MWFINVLINLFDLGMHKIALRFYCSCFFVNAAYVKIYIGKF